MDSSQSIKSFINSAREFEKHNNFESIIQHLQEFSATENLSLFDSTSFEIAEFYTILYDLLTQHSSYTELVWCIINVLSVAVRNPNVSSSLVQSYHFIIPLTTILEMETASERKLTVLKLIQKLTYGVVICYQEAHLPKLIGMLVDIIMSDESELIPTALGVMVNLCHKNKPAIYILMNCVEMKTFLSTLLNLQRDNSGTSVQVYRLMMVLNQLSGGTLPDTEILSFVQASYLRINKAFVCGNISLMQHIVDFFREARESEQGRKVLLTYPTYQEDTNNLINELCKKEVPNNWQCVNQLLEFMQQLVNLEQSALLPLFPCLAQSVLPWMQVTGVAHAGLKLLTAILHQSRIEDEDIYKALSVIMKDHLQVFIELLNNECKLKPTENEGQDFLTSLLHLFNELAANVSISADIANTVDKEDLQNLLLSLMSSRNDNGSQLFQQSLTNLCVEVLSFVSKLSMNDKEWLYLYIDLLQKKQILETLAIALYFGSYEVKKQILYLAGTSSFSKESLDVLSKCLSDLNQLVPFSPNATNHSPKKCVPSQQIQLDISSHFTKSHKENLDRLIEKLDDLYQNGQVQNSSLSRIIELYNYKLGEIRRAEYALKSSLEAADSHRAHLAHRVAQLSGETGRMHQLLYIGQQNLEGAQFEVTQLREQLQVAQQSATDSHLKFKKIKKEFKIKCEHLEKEKTSLHEKNQEHCRTIEQMGQNTANLTEKNAEQDKLIQKLEEKLSELNSILLKLEKDKSELSAANTILEEKIKLRDKSILEKEVSIENKTSEVQRLEQEVANQQRLIKGLEKTVKGKESELSAQQTQLLELERMRKVIFDITGGKKSTF